MFIGRKKELNVLKSMYNKNGFQMAVVYGRWHIGKTALLNEFIKDKDALFFSAEETTEALNLQKFSNILGRKLGIADFPCASDWQELFFIIKEQLGQRHIIIAIDEYPLLASANSDMNSILQQTIDHNFADTNIFLILCGSSISFMEDQVLDEKSPLYNRCTGQLKILPLDYYDAAKFYPKASAEDKIKYYACFGGTPCYLSQINKNLVFDENVNNLFFQIDGQLLKEGNLLMEREFSEPSKHNVVLQAIASGANTFKEIMTFTNLDNDVLLAHLDALQDLNYIVRIMPCGSNPFRSRKARYLLYENFIAFWYRYVYPHITEIELGNGDIYADFALKNLSNFISNNFKEVTTQFLKRLNAKSALPFVAKSFGKWWGKGYDTTPQEIDVVVESISGEDVIIGECKWRKFHKINSVIEWLRSRVETFNDLNCYQYLFTKDPIKMDANTNITNITINKYFSAELE